MNPLSSAFFCTNWSHNVILSQLKTQAQCVYNILSLY